MDGKQKRVTMTPVPLPYNGAKMTPTKNPAFSAEGGSDTAFVCPACGAKLGEYQQFVKFDVPVKCADCGTISKVPDDFWRSVGAP